MLFTTFLLAIAIVTAAVLGGLLFKPTRDREPTHINVAAVSVAAIAMVLAVLAYLMA